MMLIFLSIYLQLIWIMFVLSLLSARHPWRTKKSRIHMLFNVRLDTEIDIIDRILWIWESGEYNRFDQQACWHVSTYPDPPRVSNFTPPSLLWWYFDGSNFKTDDSGTKEIARFSGVSVRSWSGAGRWWQTEPRGCWGNDGCYDSIRLEWGGDSPSRETQKQQGRDMIS